MPVTALDYPDETLHRRVVGLQNLCERYQDLLFDDDVSIPDFVRLALSGRLQRAPNALRHQDTKFIVNSSRDAFIPSDEDHYVTTGDFDSVVGQSHDFPFSVPLGIFPVPSFQDTLTKTNHIAGVAYDSQGSRIKVPLHSIPNVAIGKVARRHITRIVFPRMYSTVPDKKIPTSALRTLFDVGIRKAIEEITPERLTHWPTDYDSAFRAAQDRHGRLHHSSIDLSPEYLPEFARLLCDNIAEEPDMQDAYFVHELRGMKGATHHDPSDPDARAEAFERLMSCLDPDVCDLHDWEVDIALEIHIPDHVTHIAEGAHFRLLQWLLPSLPDQRVESLLASDKFLSDRCASLGDLAGFRCEVASRGRNDQVSYLNVYCTEKSVIYQLHDNGLFRRRRCLELMPNSIDTLIKEVNDIGKAFSSAAGGADEPGVAANARFELRVPLATALARHTAFPVDLAQVSIVAIPAKTWWTFKFYRLSALLYVWQHFKDAKPEARAWPSCLTLGAFTMHQLDALMHRPASRPPYQRLLESCSPHELEDPDDQDSDLCPIMYRHGLFYLADLVISDQVWRVPTTRLPLSEDLIFCYQVPDMASLKSLFNVHNALLPRAAARNPHRTLNRRTVTMDVHHIRGQDAARDQETIHIPGSIIRMPAQILPQGDDVDNAREAEDADSDNEQAGDDDDDVESIVTRIWAQIPYDMISMGPNKKSNREESHILLGTVDAFTVTMDIFRSFDMSTIFRQIQARLCDTHTWEQIFSRYFPPKSHPTPQRGSLQGFPYMKFWQTWRTTTTRLSERDTERVRSALRAKWTTLKWIPHATSDRAWETKQANGRSFIRIPVHSTGPCPQIAINPRFVADYQQITLASLHASREIVDHDSDEE